MSFMIIVIGNNTTTESPRKFFAVPGYDLCTGWGTPTGTNLINALSLFSAMYVVPDTTVATSFYVGQLTGPQVVQTYFPLNFSEDPIPWSLVNTSPWLSASVTKGTVPPFGDSVVTISLNANAASLPAEPIPRPSSSTTCFPASPRAAQSRYRCCRGC